MSIFSGSNPLLTTITAAGGGGGGYEIERSLRFNSADSAYLDRTPASAGNRKTWTWAGWVKQSIESPAAGKRLFRAVSGTTEAGISFINKKIELYDFASNSYTWQLNTSALYRDFSAWMHIIVALDTTQATATDRVKLYVNGTQQTVFSPATYPTQNFDGFVNSASLHAIGGDNNYFDGYLADIHFIDGQALDPTSFGEFDTNGIWQPIEYTGTYSSGSNYVGQTTYNNVDFGSVDNLFDGSTSTNFEANSAGGNIVFTPTGGIAYTTSVEVYTARSTAQGVSLNGGTQVSTSSGWNTIDSGSGTLNTLTFYSGSAGNQNFAAIRVDGTILVQGYGFNSFHLPFSDNSSAAALGTDTSGNSNTWTVNNISVAAGAGNDSLVDTPTSYGDDTGAGGEVRGNYATLNPLQKGSNVTLRDGNLELTQSAEQTTAATISVSSGKWYWEITVTSGTNQLFGITDIATIAGNIINYGSAGSYYYYPAVSRKYVNGSFSSYGSTVSVGDVVGAALDLDNGEITFYKNGVSQGVMASSLPAATYAIGFGAGNTNAVTQSVNFGQRPFAYPAPSGFKALCTTNLTDPTITDPSDYMDVALYTGNGSTQTISGLGFSPDLLWIKARSATNYTHRLYDTIRGVSNALYTNLTDAEGTYQGTYENLTAFTSDGFSLGATTDVNTINNNTTTFVAWTWDAGSSTVTNTSGSISSQVRANASAGFSIVTYSTNGTSGATVGHGLSAQPHMIITKSRTDGTRGWGVYHRSLSVSGEYTLILNSTAGQQGPDDLFLGTSSTTFTLGSDPWTNWSTTQNMVAYCFAPVAGYSAFGSYTGNGLSDGPFVYTGFRPAFVLIKNSSAAANWMLYDTARNPYNTSPYVLSPNTPDGGLAYDGYGNAYPIDILSNGFKVRDALSNINGSSNTLIYAAFAENPFKYARAR